MGAFITIEPYFQPQPRSGAPNSESDANKFSLAVGNLFGMLKDSGFRIEGTYGEWQPGSGGTTKWSILGPEEQKYVETPDPTAPLVGDLTGFSEPQ